MPKQNLVLLIVIISLAVVLGALLVTLYNYKQHQVTVKTLHEIQLQVREKLVIDSVLSAYEQKHRNRLDSLEANFTTHLDSLSLLVDKLKNESIRIHARLIATDSILPQY